MTADPERISRLRREYEGRGLAEGDLAPSWEAQLGAWFDDAVAAGLDQPNAAVLSTAGADGRPRSRHVLLKGWDDAGLVFFTNLGSRKSRDLAANPWAALLLPWVALGRQVLVEGAAEPVPREEVAEYWATRPRGAQLGAWASRQSEVLGSRAELEQRRAEAARRFPGAVPLPPFWGGWRVRPDRVEFWLGRGDRLHDRLQYRATPGGWTLERLAP